MTTLVVLPLASTRDGFARWLFTGEAVLHGDRVHVIDPATRTVEAMHFLSASIVAAVEAELL